MSKLKQLLAGCMATAMLLTTAAFATQTPANGDYTMEVSYYKTTADENSSMATYMADTTIPVTVDENGYTLTLDFYNYYSKSDCTALGELKYSTDNATWIDLDLVNVSDEYADMDNAAYYDRAVVTVDSLDAFYMQAYIIPMGDVMPAYATQSWRVVPDMDTLSAVGTDTSTESMTITASVAKNVATSSVVIPESMDMGELSKTDDTVVSYAVEINEGYGQTVTVTAGESATLTAGDATLTLTNDFDGVNGTLTALAEDVAAVASYEGDLDFAGSLTFTISVA